MKGMSTAVLDYHRCGYAPSKIDRVLNLEPGTAHDLMVRRWADENDRLTRTNNRRVVEVSQRWHS
ncbi:MAG: hypothetical protein J6S36_03805 [Eggerthellaceae bacterium]|nr:hypothetical protein [Eggerthellaceae bacterium]